MNKLLFSYLVLQRTIKRVYILQIKGLNAAGYSVKQGFQNQGEISPRERSLGEDVFNLPVNIFYCQIEPNLTIPTCSYGVELMASILT